MNKQKLFTLILLLIIVGLGYLIFSSERAEAPVASYTAPASERGANESEDSDVADDNSRRAAITPIEHASFVLRLGETLIFNDPVGNPEAFIAFGEPDIILVSDNHGDHLDTTTLEAVYAEKTTVIAPAVVVAEFEGHLKEHTTTLANGESTTLNNLTVEAVPMYNLPDQGIEIRHEKGRGNGYLLTYGDSRLYIAGDTAGTPEMLALSDIDIAFIPMNLPYTMSVEEAAEAVIAFAPRIVYPYHYRTPDGLSDVDQFQSLVEAAALDIEVRLLDWYPASE